MYNDYELLYLAKENNEEKNIIVCYIKKQLNIVKEHR